VTSDDCLASLFGVRKRYGGTIALDGIDLAVRRGELLAVLGQNGAGKSTAISILLGLVAPDAGKATLFDGPPQSIAARRQVGVMMQEVYLAPELRVREQIDLVASYYPDPLAPEAAMELTHIGALARRPYGKLSSGQKRQVQLAMALCGRPRLLFLDEPTVGLDVRARELLWAALRGLVDGGASVVLTTHYLEEAEALADRVTVLDKGRVVCTGTVDELRALVVRKHVACSTALAVEEVAAWPDVEGVRRSDDRLLITTREAEAVVRRLLLADAGLSQLEVRRAGLADAFLSLTEEARS
jgi:ABC-2 type transport system ATP-binding protein